MNNKITVGPVSRSVRRFWLGMGVVVILLLVALAFQPRPRDRFKDVDKLASSLDALSHPALEPRSPAELGYVPRILEPYDRDPACVQGQFFCAYLESSNPGKSLKALSNTLPSSSVKRFGVHVVIYAIPDDN